MSRLPLVYVYLGNQLPTYARHSLLFAKRRYSGEIVLLTDQKLDQVLPGVKVIDIRSWYDPVPFASFAEASPLDSLFRGGFWLKAVERFYVLQQYARVFGVDRFFHAELDVLIFDIEDLPEKLDGEAQGIFVPAQRPNRAIASLIYVNNPAALDELVDFFPGHVDLGNEMNLLGRFLADCSHIAHGLPSETALDSESWPVSPSSASIQVGLVDSLGFGPWILGYDPRNIVGTTWNKFSEGDAGERLKDYRFRAGLFGGSLEVMPKGGAPIRIRALHLHSKRFARLRIPGVLAFYAFATRFPFRVPVTLSTGKIKHRITSSALSKKNSWVVLWLSKMLGPIGVVTIRWLITTTPKILSNRERTLVVSLLPAAPLGTVRTPLEAVLAGKEVLRSSSEEWGKLFRRLSSGERTAFEEQVAVFLEALSTNQCRVYKQCADEVSLGLEVWGSKSQVLFVSEKKFYSDAKHALTYWADIPMNNRWSFAADYQPIDPAVVRAMFPNGEADIYRWAEMGIFRPEPSLNAFQSYGIWLFSTRPHRVKLARPLEVANDKVKT